MLLLGVKIDLEKGTDASSSSGNSNKTNALTEAIEKGQSDIFKIFIKSGLFDVNGKDLDNDVNAPIIKCIHTTTGWEKDIPLECDNGLIFTMLLEHKDIDLTVKDSKGNNVIRCCYLYSKLEFVQLMKQKIREISENGVSSENKWGWDEMKIENDLQIYQTYDDMLKNNDIKRLEALFKERKAILSEIFVLQDFNGSTIWHQACQSGKLKLLKMLVNAATKEECKKCFGTRESYSQRLPIHNACNCDQAAIVKYLKQLSESDDYGPSIININALNNHNKSDSIFLVYL